ncbi:MAG TPA: hypothetical protein PLK77_02665 [Pyrinomonadaceae bacterium]|nr:hypothetical protein [Pyrinomonadaceae bacterium]
MEQETDFFHLLTQHQFIIFVVASALIMTLLLCAGFLLGRRVERGEKRENQMTGSTPQVIDGGELGRTSVG